MPATMTHTDAARASRHVQTQAKGVTKFAVENTAWAIIVGNSGMGSVRVTGTAVDRRMSIVRIDRTLASWVRERHAAEISEDSDAAAQVWIGETGLPALRDREQVGRWLHALLRRHGAVQHVEAFHGEAYREIVESQKPF
ncbi:hypothetical protein, partial [Longimicrobium sp.]|uniref:hypothetical protein n=1 Tax=Longimicrobium sp. TaxID=2029185 RepID=UPI002ED94CB1